MIKDLWSSPSLEQWHQALQKYPAMIERQGSERLPAHDRWYREQLPLSIAARAPAHLTHSELIRLTEWKMARGVWRARNLALVRSNDPELVKATSAAALAAVDNLPVSKPFAPIGIISRLAGVGPATASAIMAAAHPAHYPFLDELVAAQIPEIGVLTYTLSYYTRYAHALQQRAEELGESWTPVLVERTLWAHVGGKANCS